MLKVAGPKTRKPIWVSEQEYQLLACQAKELGLSVREYVVWRLASAGHLDLAELERNDKPPLASKLRGGARG